MASSDVSTHIDTVSRFATAEHLASGMATAALFTAMMDACADGSAATDYTVQASVVVLATGVGGLRYPLTTINRRSLLGLKPGDVFEIKLGKKQIRLVPSGDPDEEE